jgi:hypothetical protein
MSQLSKRLDLLTALAIFLVALILYGGTLAPGLVFGDPAEYSFVPHIWGISHPPGYAFQTVLGGVWGRIIPFGSVAYRANLLSAAAGAGIAALVYGSVRRLTPESFTGPTAYIPAILGGLSAAFATDLWQHSIHANAHIISALLASLSLYLLLSWWKGGGAEKGQADRWLYAFCTVAGLSVTHHPLLVFSFPAWTVFILCARPRLLLEWKTLLRMIGFALLGMSVWLYLPVRAGLPAPILFGPDNTDTLNGFLDLVLARGLRVNLFHFKLADQASRLLVFGSLMSLQAHPITLILMVAGLVRAWRREWRVGLLFSLLLIFNLGFILNSIQDVMAYLMIPLSFLMALAGIGMITLVEPHPPAPPRKRRGEAEKTKRQESGSRRVVSPAFRLLKWAEWVPTALPGLLIALTLWRGIGLIDRVSLRDYRAVDGWLDEVYTTFEGQGEGAILLAHWEHLTPLWYADWVEGRTLRPEDLTLVFVAANSPTPWVDNVWANIDRGPIYVSGFQRELIDAGFRLHPAGEGLYRVLPPPALDVPALSMPLEESAGPLRLVGVDLPRRVVAPGERIPLTIALSAPQKTEDIFFPYTMLGETTFAYTTDSHRLSPGWEAGEIIAERYDPRAPLDAAPGEYPLRLGLRNLSTGEDLPFADGSLLLDLGTITVAGPAPDPGPPILADIGHQVGLVGGRAWANGQSRKVVWNEPLIVKPGQTITLHLRWLALARPDENWKVFVHLIDGGNTVYVQQDAPPLGGAFPTFLWFPKWVEGQQVIDPYRLRVPAEIPPGDYLIQIGLYGFSTLQRAPFFDPSGNLSGDRYILGGVRVEP